MSRKLVGFVWISLALVPAVLAGQPANDACADAIPIGDGTLAGSTAAATNDGNASCGASEESPDVWFKYSSPAGGTIVADTVGSVYDTVLSAHLGCPGTVANELACNDDRFGLQSAVTFDLAPGAEVYLRVSGFGGDSGAFALDVGPAGAISGRVTDAATGDPVSPAGVEIYDRDSFFFFGRGSTDAAGGYTVTGLPAGTYVALAGRSSSYLAELYDGLPCAVSCDLAQGTPIEVRAGETTPDVDFALDLGGTIAGTVREAATGEAISSLVVLAFDELGAIVGGKLTAADGTFRIGNLTAGTYRVRTDAFLVYLDELYDDVACPRGECDLALGTPIEVVLREVTGGVDFELERLGSISGRVTDAATGDPIPSLLVDVFDRDGAFQGSGLTDVDGRYAITDLVPGDFLVRTFGGSDFLDQLYDGVPCPRSACDLGLGTPVPVSLGAETPGIDFALDRLGRIAGRVTDAATGDPIPSVLVEALRGDGLSTGQAATDGDGRYRIPGLLPGTYFARTVFQFSPYLDELYDDVPCPQGLCDPATGTPIAVELGETAPGVDFALDLGGSIRGVVTDETGSGLEFGFIDVYDAGGIFVTDALTAFDGSYEIIGLPAGNYFVLARATGYALELYDDLPCPDGLCDPTSGTPVPVSLGAVTAGVDFVLEPVDTCFPSSTALCLAGGRFRVEAAWRDFVDATGPGRAVQLTGDTGYFWFFSPGNVELVVKVLDACPLPAFESFWVFAAGLTDVEVELTVTDTVTDEPRTYSSELGVPFAPIQDTAAFATCTAAGSSETPGAAQLERRTAAELERLLADLGTGGLPGAGAAPAGFKETCFPSSTTLCLNQGRFRVEALWETRASESGAGQAVPLTGDTGYFWFFNSDNVELVVKVLDACPLPAFENFWVYAAGLTDVEVTLRVTDTVSDEVREWTNPQGNPFQPITETGVFRTCL